MLHHFLGLKNKGERTVLRIVKLRPIPLVAERQDFFGKFFEFRHTIFCYSTLYHLHLQFRLFSFSRKRSRPNTLLQLGARLQSASGFRAAILLKSSLILLSLHPKFLPIFR